MVERFFTSMSRNRRLWKHPEVTLASIKAFLYTLTVITLVRRISCAS